MTPNDILKFWFNAEMRKHWFRSTSELDDEIRNRFETIWAAARDRQCEPWRNRPSDALALVILLDQFPLNMFRGQPKSFSTEPLAIEVCKQGIDQGHDRTLQQDHLAFFYMPLMHSEDLADQNRSVELFAKAGLADNLRFARHHRDLIVRFGRFPHRNAIYGRPDSEAEKDYLASKQAFLG